MKKSFKILLYYYLPLQGLKPLHVCTSRVVDDGAVYCNSLCLDPAVQRLGAILFENSEWL